jgi:hypothetical protein
MGGTDESIFFCSRYMGYIVGGGLCHHTVVEFYFQSPRSVLSNVLMYTGTIH